MNFPRIQQDPEDVQDYGIERKTRIRRAFPNSPHDSQNPNDYDIICKEEDLQNLFENPGGLSCQSGNSLFLPISNKDGKLISSLFFA